MKMIHSSYSPMQQVARASEGNILTLSEAMRIYFTILFGVAILMLSHYYLFPQMH